MRKLSTWAAICVCLAAFGAFAQHPGTSPPASLDPESQLVLGREAFSKGRYKEAQACLAQSLKLYKAAADKQGTIQALNALGDVYAEQGDYSQAHEYYGQQLALAQATHNKLEIASAFNSLGALSNHQGRLIEAEDYMQKSLHIADELQNKPAQADALAGLGNVAQAQNQYNQALDYFNKSLALYEEVNDSEQMGDVLTFVGNALNALQRYDEAGKAYDRSLAIGNALGDEDNIARTKGYLGENFREQKEYRQGEDYLLQAIHEFQQLGNVGSRSEFEADLAKLYLAQNRFAEARAVAHSASETGRAIGQKETVKDAALVESEADAALHLYAEAYRAHVLYKAMSDSLENLEDVRRMAVIQNKEALEKVNDQVTLLQKDEAIQRETIARQKTLALAMGSGVVLLLVFGVLQFRAYRQQRQANRLLATQNDEINRQKEEIQVQNENLSNAFEEINTINETLNDTNHELADRNLKVTESITYARRIQEAILPDEALINQHLPSHFILYKPKDIVSGDFYWFSARHGKLVFAAVDCTGHGVPGAFMSMIGNTLLNQIVNDRAVLDPGQILTEMHLGIRAALRQQDGPNRDGMDICLAVIDSTLRTVAYAGANNPLYYIDNEGLHEIKADKQAIGGLQFEEARSFTTHTVSPAHGSTFYLFSDGYQDQFGGEHGRKYGVSRFKELLQRLYESPMQIQRQMLDTAFGEWAGKRPQLDDVLVMGFTL